MIKLHNKYFKPFISSEEIDGAVSKLVQQISNDMGDEIPIFVGILNGSFMFVSDFVKKYPKPCEVTFIKLASYEGLKSTEDIQRLIGLTQDLTGRTVVILEDIIDSGKTMFEVHRIFKNEKVKRLVIATLFYKPQAYKEDFKIHYVGMDIPDKFIVGFGLSAGARGPIITTLMAEIFAGKGLASIYGATNLGQGLGAATGALLTGLLFDLTGDYNFGFLLCSIFTFLGAILFWTVPQIRYAQV